MCVADGEFDIASDQKLARLENHSEGSIEQ